MKFRFVCLMAAGAIAVSAHGQSVQKDFGFLSVDALLSQLSQSSPKPLKTTRELGEELIFVRVKSRPIEQVLAEVAKALHAEWREENDVRTLVRKAETIKAANELDILNRQKKIQKELDALKKLSDDTPEPTEADATQAALAAKTEIDKILVPGGGIMLGQPIDNSAFAKLPIPRAIGKVLSWVEPRKLAEMPAGSRRVFAIRPTSMQSALRIGDAQFIKKLARESAMYAKAFEKIRSETWFYNALVPLVDGDPDAAAELTLAVRNVANQTLECEMKVADQNGRLMFMGNYLVELEPESKPLPNPVPRVEDLPLTLDANDAKLLNMFAEFRLEASQFRIGSIQLQFLQMGGLADGQPYPVDDAQFKALLEPQKQDPMQVAFGPILSQWATKLNRDMVMVVDDGLLSKLAGSIGKRVQFKPKKEVEANPELLTGRTNDLLEFFLRQPGYEFKNNEGWITMRPENPTRWAEYSANRPALKRIMSGIARRGYTNIEENIDYLSTVSVARGVNRADAYTMLAQVLNESAKVSCPSFMNSDLLLARWYGSLSQGQKQALLQGQTMNCGSGTPATKAPIDQYAFWHLQGPNMTARTDGPNILSMERTTFLPDGIPQDAKVKLENVSMPVVQGRWGNAANPQVLDANAVAMGIVMDEQSRKSDSDPKRPEMKMTYRIGVSRVLKFTFEYRPGVIQTGTLSAEEFDLKAPFVDYADLPESFRKLVQLEVDRLNKAIESGEIRIQGERRSQETP